MKLDIKEFRYLTPTDWRVLTAVETGSRNHEIVPTPLIVTLSGLRSGVSAVNRSISTLAKANLISREKNARYDGYRLTYGGMDYLALHAHTNSRAIIHLGSQMAVGKESDIYLVTSPPESPDETSDTASTSNRPAESEPQPVQSILKIHRLGRTSFRSIARNRAYHAGRTHCSWHYLSKLSAQKEFTAMTALYNAGFPVPRPIAWNRHTVVMSLCPGYPLRTVDYDDLEDSTEAVAALYSQLMNLILDLASVGVIHGDFNEFNILIAQLRPSVTLASTCTAEPPESVPAGPPYPILIDFPQITAMSHPNAAEYFDRDVACIKRFFARRFNFVSAESGPTFAEADARLHETVRNSASITTPSPHAPPVRQVRNRLDIEIGAAGFSKKGARELATYYEHDSPSHEDERKGTLRQWQDYADVYAEDEESDEESNEDAGDDEDADNAPDDDPDDDSVKPNDVVGPNNVHGPSGWGRYQRLEEDPDYIADRQYDQSPTDHSAHHYNHLNKRHFTDDLDERLLGRSANVVERLNEDTIPTKTAVVYGPDPQPEFELDQNQTNVQVQPQPPPNQNQNQNQKQKQKQNSPPSDPQHTHNGHHLPPPGNGPTDMTVHPQIPSAKKDLQTRDAKLNADQTTGKSTGRSTARTATKTVTDGTTVTLEAEEAMAPRAEHSWKQREKDTKKAAGWVI